MQITQREFCGHWADDDLSRTLSLKIRQADVARRTLADLELEMLFIQSEQRDRLQIKSSTLPEESTL